MRFASFRALARLAGMVLLLMAPQAAIARAPKTVTATLGSHDVRIRLQADRQMRVDGTAMDEKALDAHCITVLRKNPTASALIEADAAVPHGRVVRVIDQVKAAGIARFALKIAPVDPPAPKAITPLMRMVEVNGQLRYDGQTRPDALTKAVLKSHVQRQPDLSIVLEVDKTVPYARVVAILDLIKSAGVEKVALRRKAEVPK